MILLEGVGQCYSRTMRWFAALALALASGCSTLTPAGAQVAVYRAPMDALPPQRSMPPGCRLVDRRPTVTMTELDMEGQHDPFREERNAAGAAGANALLVLSRMIKSRHDSECPGSSPITDCPPSLGAWFDVIVERYECTQEALLKLSSAPRNVKSFADPTIGSGGP
jgi:hypothetical protein